MLKVVKVRWSRSDAQGCQCEMVKWSGLEAQASQMVKVRWSKPRLDSQGQMVKMVKSVKFVRWSRWLRWSCSDGGGGQG